MRCTAPMKAPGTLPLCEGRAGTGGGSASGMEKPPKGHTHTASAGWAGGTGWRALGWVLPHSALEVR